MTYRRRLTYDIVVSEGGMLSTRENPSPSWLSNGSMGASSVERTSTVIEEKVAGDLEQSKGILFVLR